MLWQQPMIICLSPHFDDACFSMYAQLHRCGGLVLTIFSQSEHVACGGDLPRYPTEAFAMQGHYLGMPG